MLLELICCLFGIGLAVSGSLTFWPVDVWWKFYIPIVLFLAGWVVGFAFIFVLEVINASIVNRKKEYTTVSKFAKFWFLTGLRFISNHAHIWVKFNGKNKVPQKQRFLLVCNHRSNFDNFVISNKLGKLDIAFITKRSNEKIPIGGKMFKGLCYISIDRDDKLQSLEGFKRAEQLITDNISSIGVFPEGTRQHEKVIGDFHEGVFNIAIHTQAPIVVCAMMGTQYVHKRWPWRPTHVRFDVLGCIPYEEYQGMTAKAVSDMVHQMMEEHVARMIRDH